MNSDFPEKFIPSIQMRRYLDEAGFQFSDMEKAAIIWNSGINHDRCLDELKKLSDKTRDQKAGSQIAERMDYERRKFELHMRAGADIVYLIYDADHSVCGCYSDSSVAFCAAKDLKERCWMEKRKVCGAGERDVKKDDDGSLAVVSFDAIGEMMDVISSEILCLPGVHPDELDNKRFENLFIMLPTPFQKGDIVQNVSDASVGILCDNELVQTPSSDYSDIEFRVISLMKDGAWEHHHINPLYLEKIETQEISDVPQYNRAVKAMRSFLLKSAGVTEQNVLHACREYAARSRETDLVEEADRLDEIIF